MEVEFNDEGIEFDVNSFDNEVFTENKDAKKNKKGKKINILKKKQK